MPCYIDPYNPWPLAGTLKAQWYYILLALAGGDRHGLAIAREVTTLSDGRTRLWPAMLYGSLAGVLLGSGASIAAARWLADLLFGVPPADVAILTSAGLVLLLTAVFANWLPARRASRVDPMRSLRVE